MTTAISGSNGGLAPLQHLSPISPAQGGVAAGSSNATSRLGAAGPGADSPMNRLLAKLSTLENTDPDAAKGALTSVAGQLTQLAEQSGLDSRQGKLLSSLAGEFSDAAATGNLAALQNQVQHHAHLAAAQSGGLGQSGQDGNPGKGGLQAYQQFQQLDTNASVQGVLTQALQNLD
jgi:hypothetical protein